MLVQFTGCDDRYGLVDDPREAIVKLSSVLQSAQREADLYGAEVNVYKRIGANEFQYSRKDLKMPGWEIECSVLPRR